MRPTVLLILATIGIFASCGTTRSAAGYYQSRDKDTELWLNEDGNFTLLFARKKKDSFHTRLCGKWSNNRQSIHLQQDASAINEASFEDSLSRFTSISSFHFRDSRNRPVPIRFLLLGKGQPKPHFGNSLYFFTNDFNSTDTIRFYFDGYTSFQYPGSIPKGIGDNAHFVTLHEPFYTQPFSDSVMRIKHKKLKGQSFIFQQKKEVLP